VVEVCAVPSALPVPLCNQNRRKLLFFNRTNRKSCISEHSIFHDLRSEMYHTLERAFVLSKQFIGKDYAGGT